jgi:hypothetical protein
MNVTRTMHSFCTDVTTVKPWIPRTRALPIEGVLTSRPAAIRRLYQQEMELQLGDWGRGHALNRKAHQHPSQTHCDLRPVHTSLIT